MYKSEVELSNLTAAWQISFSEYQAGKDLKQEKSQTLLAG
jgi:hypothetical protein